MEIEFTEEQKLALLEYFEKLQIAFGVILVKVGL